MPINECDLTNEVAKTLWDSTDRSTGCWEWTQRRDRQGYGFIPIKRIPYRTHRIAWMVTHGMITQQQYVLHRCDNPPCINPDHLFLGTAKTNALDRIAKGRPGGRPEQLSSGGGVYFHKTREHWIAIIMVNKKQRFLGSCKTQAEAIALRQDAIKNLAAV